MTPDLLRLWLFPRDQFDEWRDFSGGSVCGNYDDYLRLLDATAAEAAQRGITRVSFVAHGVTWMRRRLAEVLDFISWSEK